MKWLGKLILALWILASVLLVLKSTINWDALERNQVQSRVDDLLKVQSEVLDLIVTGFVENAELDLTKSDYQYRIFINGELINWSDNQSLPPYSQLRQADSIYYLEHPSGKYLVQRKSHQTQNGDITEFFSMLRLEQNFQIVNRFLKDLVNPKVFKRTPALIGIKGTYEITSLDKSLFAFQPSGTAQSAIGTISTFLWLLSLPMLIGYLLHFGYLRLSRKYYFPIATLALVMLRLALLVVDFPGKWLPISIFDNQVFNSSTFGMSLGDLFLNYCFLVVILGIASNQLPSKFWIASRGLRVLTLGISVFAAYANVAGFFWLLDELMTHSQIGFDITDSIGFNYERAVAFLLILLASVVYFLINHILARLISTMQSGGGLYLLFQIGALTAFLSIFPAVFPIFLLQFCWYWIMYLADLSLRFQIVKEVALEYVLSIGAMLALIFAFAVYNFHTSTELESKQKFANKLVLEKDVLGEYYLNEILEEFKSDRTIEGRLNGGIFARQNIREKIRRQFVSSYFDKYELEIFLFGAAGDQLDAEGDGYTEFRDRFAKEEYRTDYEGIYLVDDSENISQRKYACFIPVGGEGFISLSLNRKRNVPTSVFPELLVESKYEQESTSTFDYTIFREGEVLYGQGRFGHVNYLEASDLEIEKLYEKGITKGGRHFYGMNTTDGRTIVIVSSSYPNRNWVINFSFLFLLFIVIISIIGLVYRLVLNFKTLTLANKIQLYLALGFLIPLFITGFALLNTLNESYRDEITRSYLKKSLRISENLVDETIRYVSNESDLNSFANYVGDVSGFVQADLNIYNIDGQLITSSQPGIFRLNLLSDRINPEALAALNHDSQNIILDESIGLLDYKTTYTSISGYSDGQIYGIVALPFFDSKNHLRIQQKEVFADLLMIFALIFLFALISGNYILNYLIGPLKIVSDHIKQTNWEEDNQQIDYSSDDEIGVLVKEYNQMLVKLERNKEALARSQKESAWKEIARQVAHEIKNPLTPMRLKIQQLQRDSEDDHKKGVLESLIKQIDTMSHIADSFSEFAKMPAPENVDFDLVSLIHESVLLHVGKGLTIKTNLPRQAIMVWADPKIIDRIMNNLILNAKQAVEGRDPHVIISVAREENKVVVSCQDNGKGIPEEISDKIFTTYFSTKSTGSGIGLAVAKKGIENAGGHIWFETKVGEGTTFYISLPVYEGL